MKCRDCENIIIKSDTYYYKSDYGTVLCERCGDDILVYSDTYDRFFYYEDDPEYALGDTYDVTCCEMFERIYIKKTAYQ